MKGFTGDEINVTQNLKFGWGRIENIVGKGENVGYQHFPLLQQGFQRVLIHGR